DAPKVLITATGARRKGRTAPMKEVLDPLLRDLPALETVLVVRNTPGGAPMRDGRDLWFDFALQDAAEHCPAEPLDAEHPLFVLYTSGSTAKPKGILHTTGGYLTG